MGTAKELRGAEGRRGQDMRGTKKLKEDVEGNGSEKTRTGKLKRKRKEKWVG